MGNTRWEHLLADLVKPFFARGYKFSNLASVRTPLDGPLKKTRGPCAHLIHQTLRHHVMSDSLDPHADPYPNDTW